MKLTKKQAKAIGIEVWDYLAEHGEVQSKYNLPNKIFNKIEDMLDVCPLCEYYRSCTKCILKEGCVDFYNWLFCKTAKGRSRYAAIIRDKIKEW